MRGLALRVRRIGRALCALVLSIGFAAMATALDADTMRIRVGDRTAIVPGTASADLLLDYALIADQTYADSLYDSARPYDVGPDTYCLGRQAAADKCVDRLGLTPYAIARLKRWRLIWAEKDVSAFPCPPARWSCTASVPGLGVQIWMRRGRVCPEAVVAFRGTDGGSADDWLSNLRWLLRAVPLYDQYSQVEDYTPGFLDIVRRQACFRPGLTRLVAVGHSLGGGLAQTAAYRDGHLRRVLAFDPSFVTGYADLPRELRERNRRGLEINQVYEQGEILSYPRALLQAVVPPTSCDPLVRTVRLHTITGNPIARHSLNSMATAVLNWSQRAAKAGRPADAPFQPPARASCQDTPAMAAMR